MQIFYEILQIYLTKKFFCIIITFLFYRVLV
nr:MAG TPA: hypothetical protein [Bacteriophage sp.]